MYFYQRLRDIREDQALKQLDIIRQRIENITWEGWIAKSAILNLEKVKWGDFVNNEKKLYDYIKENGGFVAMRDVDIAEQIGTNRGNIPVYKKKLRDSGYIETKIKYQDNKPITLYKIVKDYTGELEW